VSFIREIERHGELGYPRIMQLDIIALVQQRSIGDEYQVFCPPSLDRLDYARYILTQKRLAPGNLGGKRFQSPRNVFIFFWRDPLLIFYYSPKVAMMAIAIAGECYLVGDNYGPIDYVIGYPFSSQSYTL